MEENYRKKIRRFQRRLNLEAWLRAGTVGVLVGSIGMVLCLLYGRMVLHRIVFTESVMAALGILLVATAATYIMLLPKKKELLARIDALGLKERMITMEELQGEETVIAKKQREDAIQHLEQLDTGQMKPRLYSKPWIGIAVAAVLITVLLLVPVPKNEKEEQTAQNALEVELMDEMIVALSALIKEAKLTEVHKEGLQEIVDALAVSLTPEDSTLTRTAKITMSSKRLDLYEAAEQDKVTMLKQQADNSETAKAEVKSARTEQIRLAQVVQDMKNIMGISIDILNQVEGTFWTPGAPLPGASQEKEETEGEEFPEEEDMMEWEELPEGEEPMEGEEPPSGEELGEHGEQQDSMDGAVSMTGTELIYDPEQGEIGYGMVFEEYYQAILKALTEKEISEEVREMIEDYATTLE